MQTASQRLNRATQLLAVTRFSFDIVGLGILSGP